MQAMNGAAGGSRSRGHLIGCVAAAALMLAALVLAPTASAKTPPEVKTYLALGDSLAFGYSQELFENNFPNESPVYFQHGYADYYAHKVAYNKEFSDKGLVLVNDGCPGETSGGLIGSEPPTCGYQKLGFPLHNPYPGKSQLENALGILKGGTPAHPIRAISLNIGANDELGAISGCEKGVKKEFEEKGFSEHPPSSENKNPQSAIETCIAEGVPALFKKIAEHTGEILGAIDGPGKYEGTIVVVGFYNPQTFLLPGSDFLQKELNKTIETEVLPFFPNAVYANPFTVFNPAPEGGPKEKAALEKYTEMFNAKDIAANKAKKEASNKKEEEEGKTVIFPFNGAGDIHPSKKGYEQIAKKMFLVAKL